MLGVCVNVCYCWQKRVIIGLFLASSEAWSTQLVLVECRCWNLCRMWFCAGDNLWQNWATELGPGSYKCAAETLCRCWFAWAAPLRMEAEETSTDILGFLLSELPHEELPWCFYYCVCSWRWACVGSCLARKVWQSLKNWHNCRILSIWNANTTSCNWVNLLSLS